MFKTVCFASALLATVNAWERNVKMDNFQTEAYGADNQNYGHQATGGYGKGYGKGYGGYGNNSYKVANSHNSYRQTGHQGQGHNQWVDNAWNQWGTNNHWDAQKSVDNKWGNNSGKVNVNLNSVSGHYDADYGQQQRGIGYEGHQNVSGGRGYTIGMGGHSFGYAPGSHSYGYENDKDYGYGGWANNLGAWNHGANYDNLGNQFNDESRDITNDARDDADIKTDRKVGYGYGDLEELDDDREDMYANHRVGRTGMWRGTGMGYGSGYGNNFGFSEGDYAEFGGVSGKYARRFGGAGNAGAGVDVADWKKDRVYNDKSYSLAKGYGGYNAGYGLSNGYGGYAKGGQGYEDDRDTGYGYGGHGRSYGGSYGGYGGRSHGGYGGKSYGGYGGKSYGGKSYGGRKVYRYSDDKW